VGHIFFALLDPDPDPDSEYGSGSTDLIESGSETLHLSASFCFLFFGVATSVLDCLLVPQKSRARSAAHPHPEHVAWSVTCRPRTRALNPPETPAASFSVRSVTRHWAMNRRCAIISTNTLSCGPTAAQSALPGFARPQLSPRTCTCSTVLPLAAAVGNTSALCAAFARQPAAS